jgi:hypothetical protein
MLAVERAQDQLGEPEWRGEIQIVNIHCGRRQKIHLLRQIRMDV